MFTERTSVGLDVHARSVVAAAIDTTTGELFRQRLIPSNEIVLAWLVGLPGPVAVTYEAGPTGFGLARAMAAARIRCEVAAPSKVTRPSGDRVKTDARDALQLAKLLRHGHVYCGGQTWSAKHHAWLAVGLFSDDDSLSLSWDTRVRREPARAGSPTEAHGRRSTLLTAGSHPTTRDPSITHPRSYWILLVYANQTGDLVGESMAHARTQHAAGCLPHGDGARADP